MGALIKQVWISAECRKLVSSRLKHRLIVISMVLGVSAFLLFLGGIMWALIAASRDPTVNLSALRYLSYAFFGSGGIGLLAFCPMWLLYVRDAKFEIRQQELRNAPDMFRFPPPSPPPPQLPRRHEADDPISQTTELQSHEDLAAMAVAATAAAASSSALRANRPRVVVSPAEPARIGGGGGRLVSSGSATTDTTMASAYSPQTTAEPGGGGGNGWGPARQLQRHQFYEPSHHHQHHQHHQQYQFFGELPPRPRAVSQTDLSPAVILEPSSLALSRPSSVTTNSSKDRFIV